MPTNAIPPQENAYRVLRTMDEAGLSKGQFRVLAHIWRRRDCTAAVRDMAHDCRMNHFYVRLVIRYLVERKMITRELRAGKRSWLALTPTESWLVLSADQKAANAKSDDSIKQLALDVQQEFYDRAQAMWTDYWKRCK